MAENGLKRRRRFVREQIEARGVRDRLVLSAMRKVPRELFVPERIRDEAYLDSPLPIGGGQTISQPYIVAFMIEALALQGGEKVLEIGAGSGYAAAVLAEIAEEVLPSSALGSLRSAQRSIFQTRATGTFTCSMRTALKVGPITLRSMLSLSRRVPPTSPNHCCISSRSVPAWLSRSDAMLARRSLSV